MNEEILKLLGDDAKSLLDHTCTGITRDRIHIPGPDFVDRVVAETDTTVYLTTYYDPSAPDPQGIDSCSGACFSAVVADVVDRLASVIAEAASRAPDRFVVVDLRDRFD